LGAGVLALVCAGAVRADAPTPPDRFTAVTAAMTPRDLGLRFDVREWSDEASRAAVVAALAGGPDAQEALAGLPTQGYVWQNGSGVGYALKYAHRAPAPQGDRVTFVTDKPLGSYDFKPWAADPPAAASELAYSVIELYLDEEGSGVGTLSLTAEVELDETNSLVSLAANGAPHLLVNAKLEPKPYWASGQ
jgi:hypothetical protein